MKSRLILFTTGLVTGITLMLLVAAWAAFNAPAWLVVDEEAHQADIAVILGGGAGSRLRTGLSLYDAGLVDRLLLVDKKRSAWTHMLKRYCSDCKAGKEDIIILEGSTNTMTDAELVTQFFSSRGIDSILVVTDPYHTRRASIIFHSLFEKNKIAVSVVSSGDYGSRLSPDEAWWRDSRTLETVWLELGKSLAVLMER